MFSGQLFAIFAIFCIMGELELWVTFQLSVSFQLWVTFELWVSFELGVSFELWVRGERQTNRQADTQTNTHINTMTQPGLRPGPSENITHDTWHVTCDTWHMTCDTWHLTCDRWGEVNLLFSSLIIWEWRFDEQFDLCKKKKIIFGTSAGQLWELVNALTQAPALKYDNYQRKATELGWILDHQSFWYSAELKMSLEVCWDTQRPVTKNLNSPWNFLLVSIKVRK